MEITPLMEKYFNCTLDSVRSSKTLPKDGQLMHCIRIKEGLIQFLQSIHSICFPWKENWMVGLKAFTIDLCEWRHKRHDLIQGCCFLLKALVRRKVMICSSVHSCLDVMWRAFSPLCRCLLFYLAEGFWRKWLSSHYVVSKNHSCDLRKRRYLKVIRYTWGF